jgi:hypothetical protein
MESRITIEVDFEDNNEPYIRIKSAYTDDLRDKLLRKFIETFGHQNGWLKFSFSGRDENDNDYYRITAIKLEELAEQAKLMNLLAVVNTYEQS